MSRFTFWLVVALVCAFAAIFSLKITDHHRHADRIRSAPPPAPSTSIDTRSEASGAPAPNVLLPAQSPPNDPTNEVPRTTSRSLTTGNARQKKSGLKNSQLLMVKGMLRDYRAAIGQNPVGNNSEITKALLGANPRQARFISADAKLNDAAELVDQRNHPYFFHQISGLEMEVRAAGPDGVMWTPDDEVSR